MMNFNVPTREANPNLFADSRRLDVLRTLTLSDHATPFGCCNFFDDCADGIFSLYYRGALDLLDWMGFNVSDECYRVVEFIPCVVPESSGGIFTGGYISDPCSDPNGIEFGSCSLSVEDFGLYGRQSPTRNIYKPSNYCKTRPRYFLDGQRITDENMWDLTFVMDQLLNDIRLHLITGNSTTAGQFDGLQRWVTTGYECAGLDSYVVNWNNNGMAGGAGITINGAAAAAGYDLVDFLLDIFRNIRERIKWSPLLRNARLRVGDVVLVLPGFMARCLLDFYTCWSVCAGAQYNEVVKNSKEMREFRDGLNGGMFGDGRIFLDGFEIPLLVYDWALINGPTRGDMYMLTGSIGQQRVWEGEHLSAEQALRNLQVPNAHGHYTVDGNRVLAKEDSENLCHVNKLWMAPRLFCSAPWAQVRFQNVVCRTPTGPLSPDPQESSFYIQTSCDAAECA